MSESKPNVPKLRFPGFTDPWEQRKLGEMLKLLKDGTHGTHLDQADGPMLLSAKNIKDGELVIAPSEERRISWADYNSIHSSFALETGDVLMTIVGTIGEATILTSPGDFTFQRSVAYLRPTNNLLSTFLFSQIPTRKFANQLEERKSVSAQPGVYLGDIETIVIALPSIDEQERIGIFFSNLDSLITLHQRKCEHLQKMKKGLLQKMFPKEGESVPELRFPGFTNPWEQRKFIELVERRSRYSNDSRLPRVEYEDIVSGMGSLNKDVSKKQDNRGGIAFEADDVLYGKLRPYLRNWLNPQFKGIALGDFWVLNPTGIDARFLFNLIRTPAFESVANESTGTKMPRADWQNVSSTEFAIPDSGKEQRQIGSFFQQIDSLITLHQRKLKHLQELKKGLLQQMFV